MTNQEVINESATLRGSYKFREAIDLVSKELSNICSDLQSNAYIEMFHAAKEAGFKDEALKYAEIILKLEPGFPTASAYIAQYGSAPNPSIKQDWLKPGP